MAEKELEDLLSHHQLSLDSTRVQISDEDLDQLSSSCCEDYRRLPPYLGVEAIVLSDIIIERELKSETDRRLAFFRKWKKIKGSGANYQALISALLKINCREDADKICVLVKSLPQSVQSKGDPDALKGKLWLKSSLTALAP